MENLFLKIFNLSLIAGVIVIAVIICRFPLNRILKAPKWINCLLWIIVASLVICAVLSVLLLTGRANRSEDGDLYAKHFSVDIRHMDHSDLSKAGSALTGHSDASDDSSALAAYKDASKVKSFLADLPDDIDFLEQNDILITGFPAWGDAAKKKSVWNDFADRVNKGFPAVLTTASFTDEGDPIFQYVFYDGSTYYYSYDNTRDHFGSPQEVTLEEYGSLYSFTPTQNEFIVMLTKSGGSAASQYIKLDDFTYSQFINMCLYWDVYLETLEGVKTIAELNNDGDLTVIGRSRNGFISTSISDSGFVSGTYLNIECMYTSPVISMTRYPGDTVYVFTDDVCDMYPRSDEESGPFSSESRVSEVWEEFYTDTEWKNLHEVADGTAYRNEFAGYSDVKMMRFIGGTVLILADSELYVARMTEKLLDLYRLVRVEDMWPRTGIGAGYGTGINATGGAGNIGYPAGNISSEDIPPEKVSEEAITEVKELGFVVMENGSVVSGKPTWEEFLKDSQAGRSASVCLAFIYTVDGLNMSVELRARTENDYPKMYCRRLSYDGSLYTIEPINKIGGAFMVYERAGIDTPAASYEYLMHYTGAAPSPTALFTSYDKYVLTHDDTITWDDIETGMYSSQFGAWVAHDVVYNEYEWK